MYDAKGDASGLLTSTCIIAMAKACIISLFFFVSITYTHAYYCVIHRNNNDHERKRPDRQMDYEQYFYGNNNKWQRPDRQTDYEQYLFFYNL